MRRCPVCRNKQSQVLYRHILKLPESLEFMPSSLKIVCCEKCGMIFTESEATQDDYNRYYNVLQAYSVDKSTHSGDEERFTVDFREEEYSIIAPFCNKESLIVDIGTGTGGMLQTFKNHGFSKLVGTDVDDKKELMNAKGFQFIQASIEDLAGLDIQNEEGNVIYILNGVLEHIINVREAMNSLQDIMTETDYLFIMVPDADEYYSHYDKAFRFFGMEHVNHFNEISLKCLLEQYGFEIMIKGKTDHQLSTSSSEPNLYVVVKKKRLFFDSFGRKNVRLYIEKSKQENDYLDKEIEKLLDQNEVIIWGAGSYFMAIAERTRLLECNIKFLVDNNIALQKTQLNGYKIESPLLLKKYPNAHICIVSGAYSESILQEIREMGLPNEVVVL